MSYRVCIDPSVNCVFIQHYGTYEPREGIQQMELLLTRPEYVKNMDFIRDCSLVDLPEIYSLEWFSKTVKETLEPIYSELGTQRKEAWILNNAGDFKTIHQWSAVERLNAVVSEREPFRDLRRAMDWIGLPEDYEINYPD